MKKKRLVRTSVIGWLLVLVIWMLWGNTALTLHCITVESDRLPTAFDGYRIAHVSDLHNAEIGDGNETLLNLLRDAKPDMIAITGDLIDSRDTDVGVALRFAQGAMEIAPCYYVPGNHEARVSEYAVLKAGLLAQGIVVLEDKALVLERSGEEIRLLGVSDPSFQTSYLFGDSETVMDRKLQKFSIAETDFTVLLSHRPELFEVYGEHGVDLVLSGHAHGGQVRLPFVGGLVAPNQGLFPKYDAGSFVEGNTHMVVSRGIGNSIIPLRFNNRPEVILIELKCEPS